jgi:hypothetical protein
VFRADLPELVNGRPLQAARDPDPGLSAFFPLSRYETRAVSDISVM